MAHGPAFLSVRLPAATRNRIKAVAAARGQSVQDLVGDLVAHFLAEQDRRPPDLAEIIRRLRQHEAALRARGVASLAVFGSVARGDATPDSDIDLAVAFAPDAPISLTGLAALRADLAELLAAPVDLAEWDKLRPPIRAAAEREAVRAF
jgi:predicted nucleotidyltransferase